MVRMYLKELNIYSSKKSFVDLLSLSSYVEIKGSVSRFDVPEINDTFHKGSIYLMTEKEANEYMVLKQREGTREAETREEENNEEHN